MIVFRLRALRSRTYENHDHFTDALCAGAIAVRRAAGAVTAGDSRGIIDGQPKPSATANTRAPARVFNDISNDVSDNITRDIDHITGR